MFFSAFAQAQEEKPLSYYIGAYVGGVYSRGTGPNAFERELYYKDLVEEYTNNGHTAEGGMFPKYSMNGGVFYEDKREHNIFNVNARLKFHLIE